MFLRLAFIALLCAGAQQAAADLSVTNARIRDLIPGQNKTVGYFDIHNAGPAARTLVGVSGEVAGRIEIHTTETQGDRVRMRRLPEVVLPPGKTVRFEPGGRHLMLFGVDVVNETNNLSLHTRDGTGLTVSFKRFSLTRGGY